MRAGKLGTRKCGVQCSVTWWGRLGPPPSLAANEVIEEEVHELGGAAQLSEPMIEESDQGLASLIRSVGMTSIADIDNLVSELQEARNYLQSEGTRIRAEVAHYTALAGAASASVKIIFDVLRAWRTTGHPAHNQSQASAFEIRTL